MRAWSEAFAVQAKSDMEVYLLLAKTTLPVSHRLHYLQMWLEKLCKSYLWKPDVSEGELRTRHQVVAKVLPKLIAEHWRRIHPWAGSTGVEIPALWNFPLVQRLGTHHGKLLLKAAGSLTNNPAIFIG